MSTVSVGALLPELRAWLKTDPSAPVTYLVHGEWRDGQPERVEVGGRAVRVVGCASELGVRQALVERDGDEPLVLVAPIDEVGLDLRARLTKSRVLRLRSTTALLEVFGVTRAEPGVIGPRWLADALVDSAPAEGYPRDGASVLTLDRAWRALLRHRHGVDAVRGLAPLLGGAGAAAAASIAAADAPERAAVREELAVRLPGAPAVLAAHVHGSGPRVTELGLLAGILANGPETMAVGKAQQKLAQLLGGWEFDGNAARVWDRAARDVLREADAATSTTLLRNAEDVAGTLGMHELLEASDVLPAGLDAREARLAEQLRARRTRKVHPLADLAAAVADVRAHGLATPRRADVHADMIERLVAWLATEPEAQTTLQGHATRYVEWGAHADRARRALREEPRDGPLTAEVRKLLTRVDDRRQEEEREYAAALAAFTQHAAPSAELFGVEHVLERYVAPLEGAGPTLLIVLDGLSHRIAAVLREQLPDDGWTEIRPEDAGAEPAVLAALPSVTAVSRTSLLTGALQRGNQQAEKAGFAAFAGSGPGAPKPQLFHKAELVTSDGALPSNVRTALVEGSGLVGVVVNAIDDHLDRDDQVAAPWSVGHIRPLPALLEAARRGGRTVVIASDHGHVLERDGRMRPVSAEHGQRWRAPGEPAAEGEVLLEGPRVLAEGGRCVAAVDERVRYSARKHGYHGGATAQETVTPLLALLPLGRSVPPGWAEAPYAIPSWWAGISSDGERSTDRPAAPRRRSGASAPPADADLGPTLFDPPPEERSWIDRLLASQAWSDQAQAAGRASLTEDRVRAMLMALDARGGTVLEPALAVHAQIPPRRVRGAVAALRQVLNRDGYPVLRVEGESVVLDRALLDEQFGLAA